MINGRFYDPSNQQGGQEDAATQKIQGGVEVLIKCLTLPENGFHSEEKRCNTLMRKKGNYWGYIFSPGDIRYDQGCV